MTVANRFARSLGANNEGPNKQLAEEIVASQDLAAIEEIASLITSAPNPDVLSDALKVIEMIGGQQPELVQDLFGPIFLLIQHKTNKVKWRAMCALSSFAHLQPGKAFEGLGDILQAMDSGSVIARDHGMQILLRLYTRPTYQDTLSPLIAEQLLIAPDNQLGQYAEKWMGVILHEDRSKLIQILEARLPELTSPSHQKRISRVLMKLRKTK